MCPKTRQKHFLLSLDVSAEPNWMLQCTYECARRAEEVPIRLVYARLLFAQCCAPTGVECWGSVEIRQY